MQLTDYTENALLNMFLQNTPFPNSVGYLALFTASPTDAGGGTEVSGGNYARVPVTGLFPVAVGTGGVVTNSSDVIFNQATADWGMVVAVALMSALSGGNMWMYSTLAVPGTVLNGYVPKFYAGKLSFQFK